MTITIDTSVLVGWYQSRSNAVGLQTSRSSAAAKDPTPPWSTSATTPRASALAKAVLAGGRFIDPSAAKLDSPSASQGADYKALFALYQGVNALAGLTEQALAKGTGETELTRIRSRFNAGMQEIGKYIDAKPFADFQVAQGTVAAKAQTLAGAKVETATYLTRSVHSGGANDEVAAFQGAVAFTLNVTKGTPGTQIPVSFDFTDMGATPRTMSNVVAYLNGKLSDAGLITRFGTARTEGTAQVIKSGTSTVTLPKSADQYALKLKGDSTEKLTFSPPTAGPAVYVTQASGAASPTQELLKFNADAGAGIAAPVVKTALGSAVAAARASATGLDGSVYVLADVTGKTDGQAIKGARDVALSKYDSAGNLVYSRTLGAAGSASGFALSVSADGSKVAVAGSVTGALDSGTTGQDRAVSDSFVSVFNAAGEEQWTQRRGGKAEDQAGGVAFGADGSVYVTGTASSALPGQTALGGADGYLEGFSATGVAKFSTQFGTASTDKPSGLVVSGSSVVLAGVEGGHAVVRRYELQATGAPTLAATRDLGTLEGGEVAGVALAADGSVIVAGSTRNGALSGGTATNAHDGGRDGFVAKLSADLQPAGSDALTYLGGADDRTLTGVAVSGGQVYVTGQTKVTPPPGQTTAFDGYVQALDAGTGALGWSTTLRGADRTDAPASISVAASGASVLDKLGLPSGAIDYSRPTTLVATTSLRVGDQFFVSPGAGRTAKAVTIEAADTFDTLAAKITRASGFSAKATTTLSEGVRTLRITPASGRSEVELSAGPLGRDALGALGLNEGLIRTETTVKPKVGDPKAEGKTYGLELAGSFDLSTPDGFKKAQSAVMNAAMKLRTIYREMTAEVEAPSTATSGAVPKYLSAQLANYQAALRRLSG